MNNVPTLDALVPHAAATQIVEELERLTESKVPDAAPLVAHLVQHAEEIAAASESFRRKLRGKLGREWLYSFMRHWLAAELKRTQSALFRRLPPRYAMGAAEPSLRPPSERARLMNCSE
ncbi:MAG: hypothetical protein Q8M07_29210 [Prosthecobacter sp.]|nr:hypothetical protein [Prosthecobacter sp.]